MCQVMLMVIAAAALPGALHRTGLSEGNGMGRGVAAAILLSAASMALSAARRRVWVRLSRVCAAAVIAIAMLSVLPNVGVLNPLINTAWRSAGMYVPLPLAVSFALLGWMMLLVRLRRSALATTADVALFLHLFVVVTLLAVHVYSSLQLIHVLPAQQLSASTVGCLVMLTIVAFARRAENSVFAVLVSAGIGGNIARIVCPCALALPFAREIVRSLGFANGWVMRDFGSVTATGIGSMLAFSVAMFMALRIDTLERRLQDLSLRDSLTGLYNRRGFYLFAEQSLWLARRARKPFSVLYIDLDDLKKINDTHGHEAGSAFIAEMAELLRNTFRETDTVGRIGGDEFAIAGDWEHEGMFLAAQRLEALVLSRNAEQHRSYAIQFSVGHVACTAEQNETLDQLLDRADAAMYLIKQQKKKSRHTRFLSKDTATEGSMA